MWLLRAQKRYLRPRSKNIRSEFIVWKGVSDRKRKISRFCGKREASGAKKLFSERHCGGERLEIAVVAGALEGSRSNIYVRTGAQIKWRIGLRWREIPALMRQRQSS